MRKTKAVKQGYLYYNSTSDRFTVLFDDNSYYEFHIEDKLEVLSLDKWLSTKMIYDWYRRVWVFDGIEEEVAEGLRVRLPPLSKKAVI